MDWKNLEPHIRAKTPRPTEPTPRVYVYNGAVVSSVDRLLDQKGIYTTIEGNDLIGTVAQLKTLSSDIIFVDNGFYNNEDLKLGLNPKNEPGYFSLKDIELEQSSISIKKIEEEIMKFFSRA
jgi:hypothetical protein